MFVIFLLLYGVAGENVTNGSQKEEIVIGFLAEYARMRVSHFQTMCFQLILTGEAISLFIRN